MITDKNRLPKISIKNVTEEGWGCQGEEYSKEFPFGS
jgi:hypothetical protein